MCWDLRASCTYRPSQLLLFCNIQGVRRRSWPLTGSPPFLEVRASVQGVVRVILQVSRRRCCDKAQKPSFAEDKCWCTQFTLGMVWSRLDIWPNLTKTMVGCCCCLWSVAGVYAGLYIPFPGHLWTSHFLTIYTPMLVHPGVCMAITIT